MIDSFGREINYLRISVTDRCNLRCVYCMPSEGVFSLKHEDILTYEEILDFVNIAVSRGISKVRITGGEPLVRKGIVQFVESLRSIEGITDLSMTTNGILLSQYAFELKKAGLMRLNVSCDSVDPVRYKAITRTGDISLFFEGIKAAVSAGFSKIKINTVIEKSPDEVDADGVRKWAEKNGFDIRYITRMDLSSGSFSPVIGGEGGICARCNRLRLTSNGDIKPCLFSDRVFNIRQYGCEKALELALEQKPASGTSSECGTFYGIGG
ncbi:MAG: radical SAM protein [Deltaproteobacteria bacterium]|nr:radical SAM protein [Deltaproteobacteria bacterium]